jgi:hypothetical protein
LFAVSLRAAPSDAVLARYDVANSIKAIYQDTFVKHLPFESALLVRRDSTDFTSGVRGDVFFACDPDIVAVIHTHPDAGYERPSQQDVRMAVRMKVPIYVVSLHETWVAGADGTIRKVL